MIQGTGKTLIGSSVGAQRRYICAAAFALVAVTCGDTTDTAPTTEEPATATVEAVTTAAPTTTVAVTSTTGQATTTAQASALEPLEVAEQWIAAYEVGDVDTFQSLMSADATSDCEGCGYDRAVTPYFGPGGAGFNDTSDSRILALGSGTIEATCAAAGQTVTCEARRSSDFDFATANGEEPSQSTSMYEFTVEDGLITHYLLTRSEGNLFDFSHIQNYRLWLVDTHPDAAEELFASTTILLGTNEQFATHQQFFEEYTASQ